MLGLAVNSLRDLRSVQTPEAAKKVLSKLLKPMKTRADIEAACKQAALEQYVEWCWVPENEYLHPHKGKPLLTHP